MVTYLKSYYIQLYNLKKYEIEIKKDKVKITFTSSKFPDDKNVEDNTETFIYRKRLNSLFSNILEREPQIILAIYSDNVNILLDILNQIKIHYENN